VWARSLGLSFARQGLRGTLSVCAVVTPRRRAGERYPKIGSRMINARANTVHEKPAYRQCFKSRQGSRRCGRQVRSGPASMRRAPRPHSSREFRVGCRSCGRRAVSRISKPSSTLLSTIFGARDRPALPADRPGCHRELACAAPVRRRGSARQRGTLPRHRKEPCDLRGGLVGRATAFPRRLFRP